MFHPSPSFQHSPPLRYITGYTKVYTVARNNNKKQKIALQKKYMKLANRFCDDSYCRPTDGVRGRRPAADARLSWRSSGRLRRRRPSAHHFSRSWPPTRRVAAAPPDDDGVCALAANPSVGTFTPGRADVLALVVAQFSPSRYRTRLFFFFIVRRVRVSTFFNWRHELLNEISWFFFLN